MLLLVLVGLITGLFVWWRKGKKHFYDLAKNLPGPPIIPILGNGMSISKYPKGVLHYMIKSSKEYGTVTRHWIGPNLYVFLTNPDDIEIVLKDNKNIQKSTTYDFLRPLLGEGLVTSKEYRMSINDDSEIAEEVNAIALIVQAAPLILLSVAGKHWQQNRKSLTPAFHFKILEKFVEVFNEKGKVLVSKLRKHAGGEAFDIYPHITLYTLDAILETSMGQSVNIQNEGKSDYAIALNRLLEIINIRTFNPLLRPSVIFNFTKLGKEHNKLLDFIHGYCKKVIQERKEYIDDIDIEKLNDTDDLGTKKKRLAFLDLLLVGKKMGNNLTDADLVDEVNTFLFAGHDTTSSAITFSIYNLAKHQDVQEKVYEEIVEIYGNDDSELTLQGLQKTVYLDMFIKESLRMFPPVPTIGRLLETDLKLSKYTIPAGTSLVSFNFMVHRNEKHYPNPEKFDPERFSAENTNNRNPYAFVPFSAGPRNCIGQRYAFAEIKCTLIDILKHYRILYAGDIQEIQNYVVLTPIGGVNVRLEKRI